MALGSDNVFPKVIVSEQTTPASPSSGCQKLYIDSADHKLKRVNSSGTVTTVESSGATLGANTFTGNQTMPAEIISGLTGSTAGMRLVGSTASGAPTTGAHLVGDVSLSLADGLWYTCTVAGTPGTWVTPSSGGGSGTLTRVSAVGTAQVNASGANVWDTLLSVSLTAGTWWCLGRFFAVCGPSATHFAGRLWDGSTAWGGEQSTTATGSYKNSLVCEDEITLTGTGTVSLQASTGNGSTSYPAAGVDITVPRTVHLYCLKVA